MTSLKHLHKLFAFCTKLRDEWPSGMGRSLGSEKLCDNKSVKFQACGIMWSTTGAILVSTTLISRLLCNRFPAQVAKWHSSMEEHCQKAKVNVNVSLVKINKIFYIHIKLMYI